MKVTGRNVAASVRQRLLSLAQARKWEFNRVLTRYGVERLLFRLAASKHAARFLLKGATLFTVWEGMPHRATKDLDLLGLRKGAVEELVVLFREVIETPVEPDGLIFEEVSGEPIRAAMEVGGIRLNLRAELASARVMIQVDIGFGDAIVPPPIEVEFPTLLDTIKPRLRAYPPETVVAEKLEAMVKLGLANSRMKDFFDIWYLTRTYPFNARILSGSIAATFAARGISLPVGPITALTPEFAEDRSKQTQWAAFIRQAAIAAETPGLPEIVKHLSGFFEPLLAGLRQGKVSELAWNPKNGWS